MLVNALVYGLISSLTLAIIASGLCLTLGVSGIPHLAIGGVYILSGYLCWTFLSLLGLPYLLAIVLSLLAAGLLGFIMYWVLLVRIRGTMSEVIVTFMAGITILELLRWKGFVGFHYNLPTFIKGTFEIGQVAIDWHRILLIGIASALLVFLWLFTRYTNVGRAFRGISQDERTALTLGIDSDWIGSLSMASGSIIAAAAAITVLPLETLQIDKGYDVLILALAVGIVGGMESRLGIVIASLMLGYIQTFVGIYISTHWMMITIFAAIILILSLKPSGLFGKFKELEERV
ncbi:MAG: branched-chain amino acid ABC transporter permease [Thermodesulfobacteriota bacterium]|nr:branched-chain amino acid ABC transporter permease [Thermodesulfobacteriota bacterium]